MSFENNNIREESLIPNSQIETMFLRICQDEQMQKYIDLIEKGHVSLATAYASNIVYKVFYALIDYVGDYGLSVEEVLKRVKDKKKSNSINK